jgi:hemerythrin-like domain-containing protein
MKTATEVLRDEHALILRALDTLEYATDQLERGDALAESWWTALVAWLRAFADRGHDAREERAFFPTMALAGVPVGRRGPLGALQRQHEEGRALIEVMAGSDPARRAMAARRYVALVRSHIDGEQRLLFPLAEAVLAPAAQRAILREFEALDAELGREATLGHAERALGRLRMELVRAELPLAS